MNHLPNVWEDPDYVTPANRLPVIITGPGWYLARNKNSVRIDEVQDNGPVNQTKTAAKGYYFALRMVWGKQKLKDYWGHWHVSGHYMGRLEEHHRDIVEKIE